MLCPDCKQDVVPEEAILAKDGRPPITMLWCPRCDSVLNAPEVLGELEKDLDLEERRANDHP